MPDAISSRFGRSNEIDVVNIVGKKDDTRMKSFFLIHFFSTTFFDTCFLALPRFNARMPRPISSRFGITNEMDVVNILHEKDEHPMRSFFLMNFLKSPFFDKVRVDSSAEAKSGSVEILPRTLTKRRQYCHKHR